MDVKQIVREKYGEIAAGGGSCCACGPAAEAAAAIGYDSQELEQIPEEANLGLGCGNPTALAGLQPGETVLDLGSGAGIDCFLASPRVGPRGRVIGVDMTDAMLERARENVLKGGFTNVEFRKGDIEELPVEDASVDVIISNCVVNLAPDKRKVFGEIVRVLKPGGRIAVSDIVLERPLPEEIRNDAAAYAACVSGALPREEYLGLMAEAGLANVRVTRAVDATCMLMEAPGPVSDLVRGRYTPEQLRGLVTSIHVAGERPAGGGS